MTPDYYEDHIRSVDNLFTAQRHCACVEMCGKVFEAGLKELWGRYVPQVVDPREQEEIARIKKKLEEQPEAASGTSLRRLVWLYQEGHVFDKLRGYLKSDLHRVRFIHWDQVVALCDEAGRTGGNGSIGQFEAQQVFLWLKAFLLETRLIGPTKVPFGPDGADGHVIPTVCSECKTPLQHGWKFCPKCGSCIFLVCVKCQYTLKPNFKICPICETPIRGANAPSTNGMLEYEFLSRGVYLDFTVSPRERRMLNRKRLELGLTAEQAEAIERRCVEPNALEYQHLVEMAYSNGVVDELERQFLEKKRQQLNINPDDAAAIEETVQDMLRDQS